MSLEYFEGLEELTDGEYWKCRVCGRIHHITIAHCDCKDEEKDIGDKKKDE